MRRALIVVGKAPVAGSAKTRLVPPLSAQDAADLYRGFLLDTLELAVSLGWETLSLVHPRGDAPLLAPLVAESPVRLLEQHADGLGDALTSAFARHFADGFDVAVLIGSDNPTLPRQPVEAACASLLEGADLTIGPTLDGGYYLIGMRQPHPGVFEGIEWSTPRAFAQTLSRARALGLHVEQVAEWYDVDGPDDLHRLAREVADGPSTLARHTRVVLDRLEPEVRPTCRWTARIAFGRTSSDS
jgi:rSAM/selenodomain-associated transferase 1